MVLGRYFVATCGHSRTSPKDRGECRGARAGTGDTSRPDGGGKRECRDPAAGRGLPLSGARGSPAAGAAAPGAARPAGLAVRGGGGSTARALRHGPDRRSVQLPAAAAGGSGGASLGCRQCRAGQAGAGMRRADGAAGGMAGGMRPARRAVPGAGRVRRGGWQFHRGGNRQADPDGIGRHRTGGGGTARPPSGALDHGAVGQRCRLRAAGRRSGGGRARPGLRPAAQRFRHLHRAAAGLRAARTGGGA